MTAETFNRLHENRSAPYYDADLLKALKAAEQVIEYSLSYYGSDEAVQALQDVQEAIAKMEGC
jgi:hypothetical protein